MPDHSFSQCFQVGDENETLPYWLSNASALLCILQRCLRSNSFLNAASNRAAGSAGLSGRLAQVSAYCLTCYSFLVLC